MLPERIARPIFLHRGEVVAPSRRSYVSGGEWSRLGDASHIRRDTRLVTTFDAAAGIDAATATASTRIALAFIEPMSARVGCKPDACAAQ
jgi:hypothetical protein